MTTKVRKDFDREFKLGAEALVAEGKPITEVADDLGIGLSTLHKWVKAHRDHGAKDSLVYAGVNRIREQIDRKAGTS